MSGRQGAAGPINAILPFIPSDCSFLSEDAFRNCSSSSLSFVSSGISLSSSLSFYSSGMSAGMALVMLRVNRSSPTGMSAGMSDEMSTSGMGSAASCSMRSSMRRTHTLLPKLSILESSASFSGWTRARRQCCNGLNWSSSQPPLAS